MSFNLIGNFNMGTHSFANVCVGEASHPGPPGYVPTQSEPPFDHHESPETSPEILTLPEDFFLTTEDEERIQGLLPNAIKSTILSSENGPSICSKTSCGVWNNVVNYVCHKSITCGVPITSGLDISWAARIGVSNHDNNNCLNLCWVISVLQLLYPVKGVFLQDSLKVKFHYLQSLVKFYQTLSAGVSFPVHHNLLRGLFFNRYVFGQTDDPRLFLNDMLSMLDIPSCDVASNFQTDWTQTVVCVCGQTHSKSVQVKDFLINLSLNKSDPDSSTQSLLNEYLSRSKNERLDDYNCPTIGSKFSVTKSVIPISSPKYLVLGINRKNLIGDIPIDKTLCVPQPEVTFLGCPYHLLGAICAKPNHYVTVSFLQNGGKVLYDDECVRYYSDVQFHKCINGHHFLKTNGYIYLYAKRVEQQFIDKPLVSLDLTWAINRVQLTPSSSSSSSVDVTISGVPGLNECVPRSYASVAASEKIISPRSTYVFKTVPTYESAPVSAVSNPTPKTGSAPSSTVRPSPAPVPVAVPMQTTVPMSVPAPTSKSNPARTFAIESFNVSPPALAATTKPMANPVATPALAATPKPMANPVCSLAPTFFPAPAPALMPAPDLVSRICSHYDLKKGIPTVHVPCPLTLKVAQVLTVVDPGGVTNVGYSISKCAPGIKIGTMVAGNSGRPGGGCGNFNGTVSNITPFHKTQEEDVFSNLILSSAFKCGPVDFNSFSSNFFTGTIHQEWGMLHPNGQDTATIQGVDYSIAVPEQYSDAWVVPGFLSVKTIVPKDPKFDHSKMYLTDLVFVCGPNAGVTGPSKSSTTRRTFNKKMCTDYSLFRSGIKSCQRAGLYAMIQKGCSVALLSSVCWYLLSS